MKQNRGPEDLKISSRKILVVVVWLYRRRQSSVRKEIVLKTVSKIQS